MSASVTTQRRVGGRGTPPRARGRQPAAHPVVPIWLALTLALAFGLALLALAAGARPRDALLVGALGLAGVMAFHLALVAPWRPPVSRTADVAALRTLSPAAFERHVSVLFRQAGYQVRHVGASGDGGVDVRVWRAGRAGIVQCKRYHAAHAVGPATVRELIGARVHERADVAWLATTGRVTAGARSLAAAAGIRVLDAEALVTWEARVGTKRASTTQ
jgi:hypothetical protein